MRSILLNVAFSMTSFFHRFRMQDGGAIGSTSFLFVIITSGILIFLIFLLPCFIC